jgi:hypothetical protein
MRDEATSSYYCNYYDASLRKKPEVPATILNEVDVKELDRKMALVKWSEVLKHSNRQIGGLEIESENQNEIESIVLDLQKLSSSVEGADISSILKNKYWLETPLEQFCDKPAAPKANCEITQRFYFYEGEEQIKLEEAYRFLSHLWREKSKPAKQKKVYVKPPGARSSKNLRSAKGKGLSHKSK